MQTIKRKLLRPRVAIGVALGLVCIALYTITLSRDVLAHDSGEWQAAGATLGVPHAPGSPAYIIVSWLFSLVPIGSAAARVNFVSVIVGTIGVVSVYALMLVLLDRLLPAIVSAVTIAVAGLWWSMSSVATPYTIVPAAMAILLTMLLLWSRSGDRRFIWSGAFIAGFGLSWHPSLIIFLPLVVLGLFLLGPWRQAVALRVLLPALALFIAGLAIYLYIPIRSISEPVVQRAVVDSPSSLFRYFTHSEYREGERASVIHVPSPEDVKNRYSEVIESSYFTAYPIMVSGLLITLLYPAIWPRLRKLKKPLIFLLIAMLVHTALVFLISGVYPQAQYYLPMLIYFSMLAGFSVYLIMIMGEVYLPAEWGKKPLMVVTAIVFGALLVAGVGYKWDFVNHASDSGARNFINVLFSEAKPDAVVLTDWDLGGGLLYVQAVDGERPDIEVVIISKKNWREQLPAINARKPEAQILFTPILPYQPDVDLRELLGPYPMSVKGRTYQDFAHGEPYPVAIMLYELKKV